MCICMYAWIIITIVYSPSLSFKFGRKTRTRILKLFLCFSYVCIFWTIYIYVRMLHLYTLYAYIHIYRCMYVLSMYVCCLLYCLCTFICMCILCMYVLCMSVHRLIHNRTMNSDAYFGTSCWLLIVFESVCL